MDHNVDWFTQRSDVVVQTLMYRFTIKSSKRQRNVNEFPYLL